MQNQNDFFQHFGHDILTSDRVILKITLILINNKQTKR